MRPVVFAATDQIRRAVLYTSCEPCAMCVGKMYWAGIRSVVYALSSQELAKLAGPDFLVPCRDLFERAIEPIDVHGPMSVAEAQAVHAGFWPAPVRSEMTIEPNKIIDALVPDRDLVLRFVAVFSRFEYSLKRSDYLKPGNKAEADWDKYANSLQGRFGSVEEQALREAVAFLVNEPPKTQVVSGGDLAWSATPMGNGEHHERYVLRLVSTVRNNLFHGGKYPHPLGPIVDVARNKRLLEAGVTVLSQCLELSESVRGAFEEAA